MINKFGSWRNTLHQLDIEPVTTVKPFSNSYLAGNNKEKRKHKEILENSLYKIVNLDTEIKELLSKVKMIYERQGRTPIRREIPVYIYDALVNRCGTYRNALYQIGLEPLDKATTTRIEADIRNAKKNRKHICTKLANGKSNL